MATVILKATERCNAYCTYCDVVRKPGTGHTMSLEVLEQVFVRANEYLEAQPHERVDLLWHGGEPLLLGAAYFEQARTMQQRHCGATSHRISHSIQTNLTCLRESLVPALRGLGITVVGTSYDPEPGVRGIGPAIDSERYNTLFMRGLRLLEDHGIGWGMIYVATRRSLARPLDVFHFLTNLSLTGGVNINPVLIYDEQRRDVAITPEEFVAFLGTLFAHWWPRRQRFPDVEPFRSCVANIIDGHTALTCVDSGSCTYHHINVAPDGTTSQCGRSADWGLLQYGSIWDRSFAEILADEQRQPLAERVTVLQDGECSGCRFWSLCHGGCPLDAWSQHRDFMHKSEWCEAKRRFLTEHFEPVTGRRFEARVAAEPATGDHGGAASA